MGLYSQFSLFIGAIFYEVISIELVNVKLLLLWGNTGLGSCEPLVTFLSTDQYNLVLCVFYFKDTSV